MSERETDYGREIIELHEFFGRWFRGELENTDAVFARFADVIGDDFHIIAPDGTITRRADLMAGLRAGYQRQHDAKVWIENIHLRQRVGTIRIVTYEEWIERDGQPKGRVSTVVFQENNAMPNGLQWLHVHETWLPEA
ncbi:MAG: hypothetical protein CUN54_05970 [Phototrophicales bacterium]|nr:MAG: hypothetical protein CUN54_05970 [Phototrophicales bacterium]